MLPFCFASGLILFHNQLRFVAKRKEIRLRLTLDAYLSIYIGPKLVKDKKSINFFNAHQSAGHADADRSVYNRMTQHTSVDTTSWALIRWFCLFPSMCKTCRYKWEL
ncbi:hypothetical protein BRADI_3g23263v3 [Brachypodium distachyon]|uniref:Uncharacterized protein n=1 Tax=Brachypodium distachyon TaxID=15368 RepID=A0A0Q3HSH7_BRADI|nr:hypothetical protein BRADI_3g23263v3 [Brachypodium distachyon]